MKRGNRLAAGKLPAGMLARLLAEQESGDADVLVGGGVGEDAAVLRFGGKLLLAKADPVTFAGDRPGWYAVQINANDIAAAGGESRWFLASLLLPEQGTDEKLVYGIFADIRSACQGLGIELVGGHTEITAGLERPVVAGFMLGEAEKPCRKQDLRPGDCLLLTKALAVEGTTLLAREFGGRLKENVGAGVLEKAAEFLYSPGISVVAEAAAARNSGRVVAMHDPTEGGLATALWELAVAGG
ncbi:MAG TPA: AIR synthase related protein, partial [Candidatus Glassbacteria bacterium]|nr:AIR synthase related protein [Candidatus Glassbacteria bacterium]